MLGKRGGGSYRDVRRDSSDKDGGDVRGHSDDSRDDDEKEGCVSDGYEEGEGRHEERGRRERREGKSRGRIDPFKLVKEVVSRAKVKLPPDLSKLLTFNKKGETQVKRSRDNETGEEKIFIALAIGPFKYPHSDKPASSYKIALNNTSKRGPLRRESTH